jgi:hypothetical protein
MGADTEPGGATICCVSCIASAARDRDLYVFCFSLPDGNFTAYQTPLMLGTDVREVKLEKDSIGQRAYDAVAGAAEGDCRLHRL